MDISSKRLWLEKEMEDPYYLKDPKLIDLYKKSLPPHEAYLYFPKGEEVIEYNSSKPNKSVRKVFNNVPYTDQEKNWITQLKQVFAQHPETSLPHYWTDALNLAFIYAGNCDIKKAYEKIVSYFKFVALYFPLRLTPSSKIIQFLNHGYIYIYGRDNRYRPIVVCNCNEFAKDYKSYKCDEILKACYFLCEYISNQMLIPGQFETWSMIINLKDTSILSLPEPLKKMIPDLSNNFVCRLHKNYIFGINWFGKILYSIAKGFLEDVTVKKITVLEKDNMDELFKEIRKDNIEKKFGGEAPNVPFGEEHGLFPPRMPSELYLKENENRNDVLISEEEYIRKLKNGEILQGCENPELLQKANRQNHTDNNINENNNIIEKSQNHESQIKNGPIILNGSKKSVLTTQNSSKSNNNSFLRLNKDSYNVMSTYNKMKQYSNILYNKWDCDQELSNTSMEYCNNYCNDNYDIINDIQKFVQKKNIFFSKKSWQTSFFYK